MNDLDICKRIAEIEGVDFRVQNGKVLPENPAKINMSTMTDVYNPLADDALCFRLMVKHQIEVVPAWDRVGTLSGIITVRGYLENPNKAICLVIIEAHK